MEPYVSCWTNFQEVKCPLWATCISQLSLDYHLTPPYLYLWHNLHVPLDSATAPIVAMASVYILNNANSWQKSHETVVVEVKFYY